MMRVTLTDTETGHTVERHVDPADLETISGVQLAMLCLPDPSESDVATVTEFLAHYQTNT